jgi:hypothetical protein
MLKDLSNAAEQRVFESQLQQHQDYRECDSGSGRQEAQLLVSQLQPGKRDSPAHG